MASYQSSLSAPSDEQLNHLVEETEQSLPQGHELLVMRSSLPIWSQLPESNRFLGKQLPLPACANGQILAYQVAHQFF